MTGQLYINGYDAYKKWGVMMDTSSLSTLMSPPGMKDVISNSSRLENGTRVMNTKPRVASRDLSLSLQMTATTESSFMSQYNSFVTELKNGTLEISTSFQPDIVYTMIYQSCSQYSEYQRGIAKLVLKLNEPNPADRKVLTAD